MNRIDLRGSMAFPGPGSAKFNPGETRFIFSLISPAGYNDSHGCGFVSSGGSAKSIDQQNQTITDNPDLSDWQGLNVIFEYGNTQTNLCDLQAFAESWQALSGYSRNSTDYMTALTSITNTVTAAGAGGSKPNGSVINRIRTNERIMYSSSFEDPGNYCGYNSANFNESPWALSTWEFRQFELDASSGNLIQVTLTNTPVDDANYASNLVLNKLGCASGVTNNSTYADAADNLLDWVFRMPNQLFVLWGTHKLPRSSPLAAAVSHVMYD